MKLRWFFLPAVFCTGFLLILQGCSKESVVPDNLQDGIKLTANGEIINIEVGHLVPCVTDWNNDSKKDLIVGQFKNGNIRLYLNQGTDENPAFKDFSYLQAGGKEISLPSG